MESTLVSGGGRGAVLHRAEGEREDVDEDVQAVQEALKRKGK